MTVEKIINILENTKRIEKTETVKIEDIILMLKEVKQRQTYLKDSLLGFIKQTKENYEKNNDITDYARLLAFTTAKDFFESYIEKEW